MMQFRNSEHGYGMAAMTLHWLMALLLTVLVVLGLYMTRLPDVGFDTWKIELVLLHKQLGILALALGAVRLGWRVGNVLPRLVESLPEWQKVAARFVHLCFYALMFALPLTGWLMSSAAGIPVWLFGLVTLPDLVSHNEDLFYVLIEVHDFLGYALVGCMAAHVGAALTHHFVMRDATLIGMLPGQGATAAPTAARTGPSAAKPCQLPH
jgi:cytochrome b561